jgi:WD40 repeat protein
LKTLRGHTLNVWHVAFSPDGSLIASGSFDKTIKIWRSDSGSLVRTLAGSKEAVVGIDFSPNGQMLASGGDDSSIRIWRVSDGALLRTIETPNHVYSVAFSADGQWLASGGRERGALGTLWKQIAGPSSTPDPTVRLWRVRDGALLQELAGHSDEVMHVALSRDGKWLASSSDDRTVALWRLQTTGR